MRTITLVTGILLCLCSSCKKEFSKECELIPAQIIKFDCDRVILELETSKTFGDREWTDVLSGEKFNNVVSFYDICLIQQITNGEKIKLYVNLEEDKGNAVPGCRGCQALSLNPPKSKVILTKIRKTPCGR